MRVVRCATAAAWLAACGGASSGSELDPTSGPSDPTTAAATTGGAADGADADTSGGQTTGAATTDDDDGPSESTGAPGPACNGHALLCDRPYDEVVFPTTHNSFAATEDGFTTFNANHTVGIEEQLAAGVRGLLLDVTYGPDGQTALCHGPCSLGLRPHLEVVQVLETFLADNPREVITIIYQDAVEPADVEADYVAVGLIDRVYTHEPGAPWPTLQAMIDADTRLVVTAEAGEPPPAWYHHAWDLIHDTPYSFTSIEEMSCEHNRGDPDNDLFLLNHWISTDAGLPAPSAAAEANAFEVLHGRAITCTRAAGRPPNFVAVDFHEQGDLFAVVDAMNGVR